jgi:hypothetical protein
MVKLVGRKIKKRKAIYPDHRSIPEVDRAEFDPQYAEATFYDETYIEQKFARLEALRAGSKEYRAEIAEAGSRHAAARNRYNQALQRHQRKLPHLIPKYEAMRQAVAACVKVDEAKDIADKAEALRAYAHQRHDHELEIMVAEIKLRAIRRMGEISSSLEKAPNGPGRGKKRCLSGETPFSSKIQTLERANISRASANRYEHVARVPLAEFEAQIETARKNHRPVRVEDMLRAVMRQQQLKPLRRSIDFTCLDHIVDIFRLGNTGDGPALQVWPAAERLREEEKYALVLALLAHPDLSARRVFSGLNHYRQLLLRLLEGDLVESALRRLGEVPPHRRKSYLQALARVSDELESYLAVDWTEEQHAAEEEARQEAERDQAEPVGEVIELVED